MLDEKKKNYYSGILMLLIGIVTIYGSLDHNIGTLSRMGPGYFPLILGSILAIIAVIILISAFMQADPIAQSPEQDETVAVEIGLSASSWRAPLCVIAGVILFIVLGKYGGLILATFAVVFMSALGDTDNSLKTSFLAALVITIFSVLVFHYGLRMQFPLVTWG